MTPTADDRALAKAWINANLVIAEHAGPGEWSVKDCPQWLEFSWACDDDNHLLPFPSEVVARRVVETAVSEVIASVRPVIEREALERAAMEVETYWQELPEKFVTLYDEGRSDAAGMIKSRILSLIPPEAP